MEYKDIKEIVKDMGESKIDELKIEFPDGTKISMKKNESKTNVVIAQNQEPVVSEINNTTIGPSNKINNENYKEIKSPMVGTFYSKSSPTAKPFVKVGDKVRKGDVVCIVEAMKLMNEINSNQKGVIREIMVKNGEMVEYNQPLFAIE